MEEEVLHQRPVINQHPAPRSKTTSILSSDLCRVAHFHIIEGEFVSLVDLSNTSSGTESAYGQSCVRNMHATKLQHVTFEDDDTIGIAGMVEQSGRREDTDAQRLQLSVAYSEVIAGELKG